MRHPRAILLIKPGSFGDIIHALPCAAALKSYFPDTRLTWLIDDRWEPLLSGNPIIDETVIFPRRKFHGLSSLRAIPWVRNLGRIEPDIAIDLQGLMRSALMARFSKAHRIIGLGDAREGAPLLYHDVTPISAKEHSVRRYLRSLETLGLPRVEKPEFIIPSGTPLSGWGTDKPFILLHPFARGGGKSLSEQQVIDFCHILSPIQVVVAGMGALHTSLPANACDLLNRTNIAEMIWLIRKAAFVVSVDSGPMHIAAAVTSRLLSIHTWSDPRLVGPFNEAAWIWQGGHIRHQKLESPSLPKASIPNANDIAAMAEFVQEALH